MVYILALVPYFFRSYSREVVKAMFWVLRNNLSLMSNHLIFRSLKAVYQNSSKYAVLFADDLTSFIIQLDLEQQH
jgi:hypothetical protein